MIDFSPNNQRKNRKMFVAKGIISALGVTLVGSIFPFLIRTVMIYTLGNAYLGLNSFYASVIQVLNLTELGIGSVMIYFLYEPISKGNKKKINALLLYLHKVYTRIGMIVLIIGILVMPLFNYLIKCDIPEGTNIYLNYILYLLPVVLQYFVFPELIILLQAYQRNDIANFVTIITSLVLYIFQIVALLLCKSYLLYMIGYVVYALSILILRTILKKSEMSEFSLDGFLDKEEIKQIRKRIVSMIGHQIDEKMFSTIDNFFISAIIGLGALAIYGNYFLIITMLIMLMEAVYGSLLPSIGNAVSSENVSSNFKRFKYVLYLNSFLTTWATGCLLCLYNDFIGIWTGEVPYNMQLVVLLCGYFYLVQVRRPIQIFKNANGLWWNDRYKPYISIMVDFILDLILIPRIGVAGALISSVVCLIIIEIPWETKVLFDSYFTSFFRDYFFLQLKYFVGSLTIVIISTYIVYLLNIGNSIRVFILKAFLCSIIIFVAHIIVFWKTEEFKIWIRVISEILNRYCKHRK